MLDPGAGSQIVDMTPGTHPNGLFWTSQIPGSSFEVSDDMTEATLTLRKQALTDTFEFGRQQAVSAQADIELTWRTTSDPVRRGFGTDVDPTDPGAFRANFADAVCTGKVSALRTGFSFESRPMTSAGFYASLGTERNGVWL